MNKMAQNVLKGAAAGAVVGTAAYMVLSSGKAAKGRQIKKKASKAIRQVGDVFENISYML